MKCTLDSDGMVLVITGLSTATASLNKVDQTTGLVHMFMVTMKNLWASALSAEQTSPMNSLSLLRTCCESGQPDTRQPKLSATVILNTPIKPARISMPKNGGQHAAKITLSTPDCSTHLAMAENQSNTL